MKRLKLFTIIHLLTCSVMILGQPIDSPTLRIVFAGGQSNMLGLRSVADSLPQSDHDRNIAFYFHEGLKPSAGANAFISTSENTWTHLQPQRQVPFIKYSEYYFGPEYTMARTMFEGGVNDLAVIKMAYGGTNLAKDWMKGNTEGEQLYPIFLEQMGNALDSLDSWDIDYEFIGMAWLQGESDGIYAEMANNYESNLQQFISDVRSDLATPHLKVVLAEIANGGWAPYLEQVRTAQAAVAASDPLVKLIDTDDLPIGPDNVHWETPEVMAMGTRMGEGLLGLVTSMDDEAESSLPYSITLLMNYPNPFNPSTTISYQFAETNPVRLSIFNTVGQEVAILLDEPQMAGEYDINWNGRDQQGNPVSAGIYLCRLSTSDHSKTIKLLLVK